MTPSAVDAFPDTSRKTQAAYIRIGEFQEHATQYIEFSGPPFVLVRLERGDYEIVGRTSAPLPELLSTLASEAIHHLRSALDVAVNELMNDLDVHSAKYAFPFSKTADGLDRHIREKLGQPDAALREAIVQLKPYPGGNDWLSGLNEISNLDKHRRLLAPIVVGHMPVPMPELPKFPQPGTSYKADLSKLPTIPIAGPLTGLILEPGAKVIGAIPAGATSIAMSEHTPFFEAEAVTLLYRLANEVERAVHKLKRTASLSADRSR